MNSLQELNKNLKYLLVIHQDGISLFAIHDFHEMIHSVDSTQYT